MGLREGDIKALENRAKLDGRPIQSTLIRDGKDEYFYRRKKDGRIQIDAVRPDRGRKVKEEMHKPREKGDPAELGPRLRHMLNKRLKS
jgi:hypothetical protein